MGVLRGAWSDRKYSCTSQQRPFRATQQRSVHYDCRSDWSYKSEYQQYHYAHTHTHGGTLSESLPLTGRDHTIPQSITTQILSLLIRLLVPLPLLSVSFYPSRSLLVSPVLSTHIMTGTNAARLTDSVFCTNLHPPQPHSHTTWCCSLPRPDSASDYRSPATKTNHYATDDPTAAPIDSSNATTNTNSHLAIAGQPADGITIVEHPLAHINTSTTATATQAQPMKQQPHHTAMSNATGDGLVVDSNIGGPLGGTKVTGTHTGDSTADGRSVNPGINIGVSTHQYTAPVGTTGIGGGVADSGTGMAGVVQPTNPVGQPVNHSTASATR